MDFGIMFFLSADQKQTTDKYKLILEATKFADKHGFSSVWTPERHFHEFGGIFPNPSVVSAALAAVTGKIQIRAGSVISPLHDAIRIAEEWSVVDNISNGRVGISFGSGWNINDFILSVEAYSNRQSIMYEQIETVKKLWKGESVERENSAGKNVEIKLYPRPIQDALPIWVTSSGNVETFIQAGKIGANVLTHLIGQTIEVLEDKISRYRAALKENGFSPDRGKVTLMIHTFLGADEETVKAKIRAPFREYLRAAISLEEQAALGGGVISGGHKLNAETMSPQLMEELLDLTFERYYRTAALMGSPASCRELVAQLKSIGVDELASLIDMLPDSEAIMESLGYLHELKEVFSEKSVYGTHSLVNAFLDELD